MGAALLCCGKKHVKTYEYGTLKPAASSTSAYVGQTASVKFWSIAAESVLSRPWYTSAVLSVVVIALCSFCHSQGTDLVCSAELAALLLYEYVEH